MIKELCRDKAILSQRCEDATTEDAAVAQDLIDTIKSLDDAGCLAANQIGVTKKVCVYLDDAGDEICLTCDEVTRSTRYIKCKIAFDELVDGAFKERRRDYAGFEAQMIQHMIDHCAGKLV